MKLSIRIFSLLLLALLIVGCQGQSQDSTGEGGLDQAETLTIYTTIYPLEFLVNQIGQDYVNVESILPPGSDAHSFEPTSKMMVEIAESDLFIYNDEISESYAASIKSALEAEEVEFLAASTGLDKISFHHSHDHGEESEDDHDHGDFDPHVWLSPRLMNDLAENVLAKLIELAPEQEEFFKENVAQINAKLTDLDEEFRTMLDQATHKKILVTHAAYGYWTEDYDLEQIAITGLSATEEPSQRQLAHLIEHVKELELDYVLFEQNMQPRVATVIQSEAGMDSLELHNLAVLTQADLDAGEDYFSLMERNIGVLKQALK